MSSKPTSEFLQLLAQLMASYAKPLPDAVVVQSWWTSLAPFRVDVIRAAFDAYSIEKPDFAPVPNSIAARCRLLDGRPGAEEAWALALTSIDQSDTVVWSTECAEAFRIVKPVLDSSGAISARKGFVEAYERLVAAARSAQAPIEWVTSIGWDKSKRDLAVGRAVKAGILPQPAAAALLPPPKVDKAALTDHERKQLHFVLGILADGETAKLRKLERAEQERLGAEMALDIEIQLKVDQHQSGGAT